MTRQELLGEAGNSPGAADAARTIYRPARPAHDADRAAQRASAGSAHSPGAATLLVAVEGRVLLRATNRAWRLAAGDIVAVPPQRRSLLAETDAVVLLTVRLD